MCALQYFLLPVVPSDGALQGPLDDIQAHIFLVPLAGPPPPDAALARELPPPPPPRFPATALLMAAIHLARSSSDAASQLRLSCFCEAADEPPS